MVAKAWRPTNLARNWYLDHEKRLEDAIIAQNGIEEEGTHPDGIHRWQNDPFGQKKAR